MKRIAQLQHLSREHHHDLVLASKLGRLSTTDAAALSALQATLQDWWPDMQQHMAFEEQHLLPALQALAPGRPMATRMLADHAELTRLYLGQRSLPYRAQLLETLQQLGKLLREHVRFEEQVVFPLLQAHLSPAQLQVLEAASQVHQNLAQNIAY